MLNLLIYNSVFQTVSFTNAGDLSRRVWDWHLLCTYGAVDLYGDAVVNTHTQTPTHTRDECSRVDISMPPPDWCVKERRKLLYLRHGTDVSQTHCTPHWQPHKDTKPPPTGASSHSLSFISFFQSLIHLCRPIRTYVRVQTQDPQHQLTEVSK